MDKYYTSEKNVRIVISLLKAHGIRRVIASPGTTNMTFIGSIQNDPFFTIYSSVDERSAAYLACGIASESGEPVVISCTGATASRNYLSGLTEAYYRKLPILAITSHRGDQAIGHLLDQQIDRRAIPNDIALCSVTVPLVKEPADESYCLIEATKAILALSKNGGGPAHINLHTKYSQDFSYKSLPEVRKIQLFTAVSELPCIPAGSHIGIFIGSHRTFTKQETDTIDNFCKVHNAVVFCDHTSGYNGAFGVNAFILFQQLEYRSPLLDIDVLIHIGEISSVVPRMTIKTVWRVSPDGNIRDTFHTLSNIFYMEEDVFFKSYTPDNYESRTSFKDEIEKECESAIESIPELPFSNVWIAQNIHQRFPENSRLFLGINNSLRAYNFFDLPKSVESDANVGGYGIDGGISTLIGSSLYSQDKIHFGVFGDLAFFYDMNVLGNRHVGNNVRILLINNGRGTEFRNFGHICSIFGEDADRYIAAAGHFGNKSKYLVKHYSEDLGYTYLSANSKESFLEGAKIFLKAEELPTPIIFEVFTDSKDESDAIKIIRNLLNDKQKDPIRSIKRIIKGAIGAKGHNLIKSIINRHC